MKQRAALNGAARFVSRAYLEKISEIYRNFEIYIGIPI